LTNALFPRVDAQDPQARLSVPSYVTEAYKIARHLGVIGGEAEYTKLVSGRVNSLVSNMVDVYRNEDWRGVTIANPEDDLASRTWDQLWHIFVVPPISIKTAIDAYKMGGMTGATGLALAGFTDAPAAAKRSDAANLAFSIRRKEYKGREVSPDEFEQKEEIKRAAHKYANGDKQPLLNMLDTGAISRKQFDTAIERLAYIDGQKNYMFVDPLGQALKGLTITGAIKVWAEMTPKEKQKHRAMIIKKYGNMMKRDDHSKEYKERVRTEMMEAGVL
jgi:hypothetical protein